MSFNRPEAERKPDQSEMVHLRIRDQLICLFQVDPVRTEEHGISKSVRQCDGYRRCAADDTWSDQSRPWHRTRETTARYSVSWTWRHAGAAWTKSRSASQGSDNRPRRAAPLRPTNIPWARSFVL